MTPLALPRLLRNDSVAWRLRSSKSAGELLPHTHTHAATDALLGMQRRASAEDSTGWVEHEEFLAQRHSTRRKRLAELVLPKRMSSFEDFHGELPGVEILGTMDPAQNDICSLARRNRFFEHLNDTTGRPKRVFRKTPPPPIIRGVPTADGLTETADFPATASSLDAASSSPHAMASRASAVLNLQ